MIANIFSAGSSAESPKNLTAGSHFFSEFPGPVFNALREIGTDPRPWPFYLVGKETDLGWIG
jgi:hypothetical protein